jgi:hypothetical protein
MSIKAAFDPKDILPGSAILNLSGDVIAVRMNHYEMASNVFLTANVLKDFLDDFVISSKAASSTAATSTPPARSEFLRSRF